MRLSEHLFSSIYRRRIQQYDGIPGPVPRFPLGNALDFVGCQPWETCADYSRRFGGMTLTWLVGTPALVLNDAALIRQVLVERPQDFYKKDPVKALVPVTTSEEVFVANGASWQTLRDEHPFSSAYFPEWLAGQVRPMGAVVRERVRELRSATGATLDLTQTILRMSFDAFAVAVAGEQLAPAAYTEFMHLGKTGSQRMNSQLAGAFPPLNPLFYARRRTWFQRFERLIAEAGTGPGKTAGRPDLISTVARSGSKLPAQFLPAAYANIFYGGVYSASSAVVTALYLLDRHPAAALRLRAELSQVASDTSDADLATLASCDYLDWVLREAMRYLCPVPLYMRDVLPDRSTELGGFQLPGGTTIMITPWALHRSAEHWNEPDRFNPERWAGGVAAANPYGSDYFFPFGRGKRLCLGFDFALAYMRVALATLVTHAQIEVESRDPYLQEFFFGVMLPKQVRARFR